MATPILAIDFNNPFPPLIPFVNLLIPFKIFINISKNPRTALSFAIPIKNSFQAFFNLLTFVSTDSKVFSYCDNEAPEAFCAADVNS